MGRRQGLHKIVDNTQMDAFIDNLLTIVDERSQITVQVNGGRTQTKHEQRRFFARLRYRLPDTHREVAAKVQFVSAREFVHARHDRPKPRTASVGGAGHAQQVAAPPPRVEQRAFELSPGDGPLYTLVQRMRGLMREAGLQQLTMDADSRTVVAKGMVP